MKHKNHLDNLDNQKIDTILKELNIPFNDENIKKITSLTHNKLKVKPIYLFKRKRNVCISLVAILLLLPTAAFAANKLWEVTTNQEGYLTTILLNTHNVTKNNKTQNKEKYKLQFKFTPKDLVPIPHTDGLKYYNTTTQSGGFSAELIRPRNKEKFVIPYTKNIEKEMINNHIVQSVTRQNNSEYSRVSYVFFEEDNLVVQLFFHNSINKSIRNQIISGLLLSKEANGITPVYDMNDIDKEHIEKDSIVPLAKNSNNIHKVGDSFTTKSGYSNNGSESSLKVNVISTNITHNILNYSVRKNEYNFIDNDYNKYVNKEGILTPISLTTWKSGDGKTTLDQPVKTKSTQPIYQEFTFEIKNTTEKTISDIYFNPEIHKMMEKSNTFTYDDGNTYSTPFNFIGEPIYISQHGKGKSYNNIGSLSPKETKTITVGYIIINPMNQKLLMSFDLNGHADNNLNKIDWLDINNQE